MLLSRKAAKAAGDTYYLTKKPCKRGHVSGRYVSTAGCVTCSKQFTKDQYRKSPKRTAEYLRNNPDKRRTYAKSYLEKHRAKYNALLAKRRARKLSATPLWLSPADLVEIEGIYQHAFVLSQITGEPHDVDHIVPLQGKNVCGLHVPWNLQAIPASTNRSKSNSTDQANCASVYDEELDVWHLRPQRISQT